MLHGIRRMVGPAQYVSAVTTRGEWAALRAALRPTARHDLARLGSDYGGWIVPTHLIQNDWLCYSGGIGTDLSFDLELIERYRAEVHAFDPVPASLAYAEPLARQVSRLYVHPWGLWSRNETQCFYAPKDPNHISHSIHNLQATTSAVSAMCKTIQAVMHELGHDKIDLLKLDIEGAELEVLPSFLGSDCAGSKRPQVLCVEFHTGRRGGIRTVAAAAKAVCDWGYRAVAVSRTDVTYVRTDI